jgi:leucyl aminopeptidase
MKFALPTTDSIKVHLVRSKQPDDMPSSATAWAASNDFTGQAGRHLVVPYDDGSVNCVLIGLGSAKDTRRGRFIVGGASSRLPEGIYEVATELSDDDANELALGWLLGGYKFDKYVGGKNVHPQLIAPANVDAQRIEDIAAGEILTRDLINIPASDMGPAELAGASIKLAEEHGAEVKVTIGDDLLDQNFPMIHTVGRASVRAPRLVEFNWGTRGPKLTLVGKGVCFDTGGLNIKPGASMGLMKKDMGGAATVLGLAHMIMAQGMPVQLRVLIPAVENSIDGNAFRPQDILSSRKGLTVEINNTDAEGRLVLADALALADEEDPDLVISMATLTGAARVAVGPDLAPFYTDEDSHAAEIMQGATNAADPAWRMPFYDPYESMIEPGIADLDNAPRGGFAGSITAALFLRRFVDAPYIHFDIYGWQPSTAPSRPKGGVGMGARALFDALPRILNL